ncbi:unnamed protein product [Spirodela intermedia]|uniref:Uncharacterized protein n=1 Tax=Spirodela intermedia TaxID=51605 RepID=A0A7I8LHF4_SPIIN|nr:unnamed protein product [Spirodela intermedia]
MRRNGDIDVTHGKTATLRLSGDCHPTERSWMELGSPPGMLSNRAMGSRP